MRIDAYTHFFPKQFFDKLMEIAGDYKDMGKRVRSLPALYDLDFRKKIVDEHKDYQQILSYPQPPFESFCKTPAADRRVVPHHQRRLRRAVRQGEGPLPGLGRAGLARRHRRRRRRSGARDQERRARRADLHQRRSASRSTCRNTAVLEEDERARQADLDPSGARRRDAGLSAVREEVAVRNLVDARLVLRDRLRDDAAGLFQDHGRLSRT